MNQNGTTLNDMSFPNNLLYVGSRLEDTDTSGSPQKQTEIRASPWASYLVVVDVLLLRGPTHTHLAQEPEGLGTVEHPLPSCHLAPVR